MGLHKFRCLPTKGQIKNSIKSSTPISLTHKTSLKKIMYFSTHFYYGIILANLGLEGVHFNNEIEPSL